MKQLLKFDGLMLICLIAILTDVSRIIAEFTPMGNAGVTACMTAIMAVYAFSFPKSLKLSRNTLALACIAVLIYPFVSLLWTPEWSPRSIGLQLHYFFLIASTSILFFRKPQYLSIAAGAGISIGFLFAVLSIYKPSLFSSLAEQ